MCRETKESQFYVYTLTINNIIFEDEKELQITAKSSAMEKTITVKPKISGRERRRASTMLLFRVFQGILSDSWPLPRRRTPKFLRGGATIRETKRTYTRLAFSNARRIDLFAPFDTVRTSLGL